MLTWHQANSYLFLAKAMLNKLWKTLLKQVARALTLCCIRWNAGWTTTSRVYLTKHKNRKVADVKKSFGSVNWNSRPCMTESSSKTLAPSSL